MAETPKKDSDPAGKPPETPKAPPKPPNLIDAGKARSGEIKIEGDAAEAVMLAYEALDSVAELIAKRIEKKSPGARIAIRNDADFEAMAGLNAANLALDMLAIRLRNALKDGREAIAPNRRFSVSVIAAAAEGAASLVSQLLSLLRVDSTTAYRAAGLSDQALIVAVTGALSDRGMNVVDTTFSPGAGGPAQEPKSDNADVPSDAGGAANPVLVQPDRAGRSGLYGKLLEITELGGELETVLLAIERLRAQREAKKTDNEGRPAADGAPQAPGAGAQAADDAVDDLDAAKQRVETSIKELDAATKALEPSLARLLSAETLSTIYDANTQILSLKVMASSQATSVEQGFFWFQNKTTFSGGVVVSYGLYNRDGSVVSAGTIPAFSGRIKLKALKPGEAAYGAIVPRRELATPGS